MNAPIRYDVSLLTEHDIYLFKEGCHYRLHDKLGAHTVRQDSAVGTVFAVWAPNAASVAVIGDFNDWNPASHPLVRRKDPSGIWEGFIPNVHPGTLYKYRIHGPDGYIADRADPFAFRAEAAPGGASVVADLAYEWQDADWLSRRRVAHGLNAPWTVYEVHLGSWRRVPEENMRQLSYRESAVYLAEHLHHMGFTHVQLLAPMESAPAHARDTQAAALFSPAAHHGTPQDLMFLIDHLHQQGIGVVLDWQGAGATGVIPALRFFDGTPLFEQLDVSDGNTSSSRHARYNYHRPELRAILISSALFWLERYHADGLCLPDVEAMLYGVEASPPDEHRPIVRPKIADAAASTFLHNLNEAVYRGVPDVQTFAGACASCSMISRPTYVGGLGFGMAWNTRWMHDTLQYLARDPITRKYHQDELTFSCGYASAENFVLPLPHDEVVPGKGALLARMFGKDQHKFSSLRLLFGYMYGHPGKKLLFMGGEFATWMAWQNDESLPWHLLQSQDHQGVMRWVRDLNHLYRDERSLHELDFSNEGFEWIDAHDTDASVISFLRKPSSGDEAVLVVCNGTPVTRRGYRLGAPRGGPWREMLNSDARIYGGSGVGNMGRVEAAPVGAHGRYYSLVLDLPPLSALFFKPSADD